MASIDQIINRQFKQWEMEQKERRERPQPPPPPPRIVTVSREHGSRGAYFASRLAEELQYTLMHREVIDAICKSSGYRKHIVQSLDERYRSDIVMLVESILTGQAVHHTDYARNLCTVVLSMSQLGGVVLVGRAGSFILGPRRGFHIRVVCPPEKRVENLVRYTGVTKEDASAAIERIDAERRDMVRRMFDADIDDPHRYDMIVNSEYIDVEDMVPSAIRAIRGKLEKLSYR